MGGRRVAVFQANQTGQDRREGRSRCGNGPRALWGAFGSGGAAGGIAEADDRSQDEASAARELVNPSNREADSPHFLSVLVIDPQPPIDRINGRTDDRHSVRRWPSDSCAGTAPMVLQRPRTLTLRWPVAPQDDGIALDSLVLPGLPEVVHPDHGDRGSNQQGDGRDHRPGQEGS